MSTIAKSEEARRKLIEAAGQVFAEVGYEAATVRQITDRAQVNIAAVNYHFGDKAQLYRTVLKAVTGRTIQVLKERCGEGTPEERLRQFVRSMLLVKANEESRWAHLLMAREVAQLHEAVGELVVEVIRPVHDVAESIIRDLAGCRKRTPAVKLAASLVVSLTVHRVPQQRIDSRLSPEIDFNADPEAVTEQVCRFVLAGVRALFPAARG
jgi:AcrR family transcriptional regulator